VEAFAVQHDPQRNLFDCNLLYIVDPLDRLISRPLDPTVSEVSFFVTLFVAMNAKLLSLVRFAG
jgi:hypothetical protein